MIFWYSNFISKYVAIVIVSFLSISEIQVALPKCIKTQKVQDNRR